MKKTKKILSLLLAVVTLVSMLSVLVPSASAATKYSNCGEVVKYNGSVYYWKYTKSSFSSDEQTNRTCAYNEKTTNKLICRTGTKEKTITTDKANGNLCIVNGKIYYQVMTSYVSYSVKSCTLAGKSKKTLGVGEIKGIMGSGKYIVCYNENNSRIWTVNTSTGKTKVISTDEYLACTDKYIITAKSTGSSANNKKITIYRMKVDGSAKTAMKVNKAISLKSVKESISDGYYQGYTKISYTYINNGILYYVFEDIAGTGHCTQSCNVIKITISTGKAVTLSGSVFTDSGEIVTVKLPSSAKVYTNYLNNIDGENILKKAEYKKFSTKKYGYNSGGMLSVQYYEKIGTKYYVLLTESNEAGNMGWRTLYKFSKCALFEKDTKTGKVTMIYSAK